MMWWFIVLGCSTLVVVCVAIVIYIRIRRHLKASEVSVSDNLVDNEQTDHI